MRKMMVVLMLGTLLLPNYGFTLGLGEIEVNSALNQQLDARIELLSAAPEDAEALIVELASREEFNRAGLDRPYTLNDLKFSSYVEKDKVFIRVKSSKPVREPFLNFLIEIDWPKGHLLREYTILLDPPVFMGGGPAASSESSRPAMFDSGDVSAPATPTPTPTPTPERFSVPGQSSVQPGSSGSQAMSQAMSRGAAQMASVVPAPIPPEYIPEPEPAPAYGAVPEPEPVYAGEPVPEAIWLAQQSQTQMESSHEQPRDWRPEKDYQTKKGDTAWSLADRMRPDESISIQQMMLAMLRTNPEIFINGNVNGLKRGFILRVPDRNEINASRESVAEARNIAQEHNALWREYRQALAGDVPASALEFGEVADASPGKTDDQVSATDKPAVDKRKADAATASDGGSRLSIVSAGEGSSAASSNANKANEKVIDELHAQLAMARESLESGLVEKEGLQSQVASLEQQITKMQSLLTIQDTALAEAQSLGKPGMEGAGEQQPADDQQELAIPETEESIVPEEPVTEEPVVEEMMSEEAAMAALNELSDESVPAEAEVSEEVLIDAQPQEQPAEQSSEIELMDVSPVEETQQESGLIDALLNNKLIIGAVFLFLLIIAAAGYVMFKQFRGKGVTEAEAMLRADSAPGDDLVSDPFDDLPSDEEVAKAAAEEEFDSDATTILPSAPDTSAHDTVVTKATATTAPVSAPSAPEERDDVIAEADVYLAYGIYQQAEELLENAIKDNPDKDSYRVKLAETYFASKNVEAMEKFGIEMQKHVGVNNTPAWEKVVAMGKELCPDAAVFKNAGVSAELDMDKIAPKSPEPMDFDLGDGGDEDAGLDFDFDEPASEPDVGGLDMDETAVLQTPEVEDDGLSLDSNDGNLDELEFDIGEATASDDDFSLDIDSSELDLQDDSDDDGGLDFDLDLSSEAGSDELSLDVSVEDAGDDLSADLDLSMDFDESSSEESSIEIDASELDDLSLDETPAEPEPEPEPEPEAAPLKPAAPEPVVSAAAEAAASVDLSDIDVDEINTKLDLARAYLDMGDHEGTRDILDEVIAGGTPEQKGQAQELLKELA